MRFRQINSVKRRPEILENREWIKFVMWPVLRIIDPCWGNRGTARPTWMNECCRSNEAIWSSSCRPTFLTALQKFLASYITSRFIYLCVNLRIIFSVTFCSSPIAATIYKPFGLDFIGVSSSIWFWGLCWFQIKQTPSNATSARWDQSLGWIRRDCARSLTRVVITLWTVHILQCALRLSSDRCLTGRR